MAKGGGGGKGGGHLDLRKGDARSQKKKKHFWPLRALGPDYMMSFIPG